MPDLWVKRLILWSRWWGGRVVKNNTVTTVQKSYTKSVINKVNRQTVKARKYICAILKFNMAWQRLTEVVPSNVRHLKFVIWQHIMLQNNKRHTLSTQATNTLCYLTIIKLIHVEFCEIWKQMLHAFRHRPITLHNRANVNYMYSLKGGGAGALYPVWEKLKSVLWVVCNFLPFPIHHHL